MNLLLKLFTSISFLLVVTVSARSGACMPAAHDKCPNSYNMPAESMIPTLFVGDNFSVDTQWFVTHWPEPGDVVVFLSPTNSTISYVKRVVGIPGDRIQMRNGIIFINDVPVEKVRIEDYVASDAKGEGGGHPIRQYEETLPNGVKYRVLDKVLDGSADNTVEYLVPPKHYFLLGDNRDNSEDSRYLDAVGYVPRDNIVGKATSIYFSWNLLRIGIKIQ